VVQIFSSNPRTWRTGPIEPEALRSFAAALRERHLPLFLHTIYLVNLASPDEELRAASRRALLHALICGGLSEAAGVVTHVGSHRGLGFERALPLVAHTIFAALQEARERLATDAAPSPTIPPLLLETGAGAGATIGGTVEELAALVAATPDGTGLCLDTAHLFAAGHPVHERKGLESLVAGLSDLDLLPRVALVHLNDSAAPLASHHDRHANPGEGHIGLRGLARVVRHEAFSSIPFVLETPGPEKRGPSAAEVATVKAMRHLSPAEPAANRKPAASGRP
jgi:deoxyribonuclease-4